MHVWDVIHDYQGKGAIWSQKFRSWKDCPDEWAQLTTDNVNFSTRSRPYQREASRPSGPGRGFSWIFSLLLTSRPGPPAPMNHVKIFKGCPPRDTPSELVQLWDKTFPLAHIDLTEMKNRLGWVVKPVPHNLVRRIRFWTRRTKKNSERDIKYMYWTIRNFFFWNLFTCKGT